MRYNRFGLSGRPAMAFSSRLKTIPLVLAACLGAATWMGAAPSVSAAPRAQPTPFLTPTPGPDGWIVYEVQPDDTLWRIAAIAGISLEELMALNGIQPGDYISPNMRLRLGQGGPVVATAVPGQPAAPTAVPPTPTEVSGSGEICVLLYRDGNGDARWQETEPPLEGGRVSVADASGAVVRDEATDGTTELDLNDTPIGQCFVDLPYGDYNVSAAVPPDHNPTTAVNIGVHIEPGESKHVAFGAQPSGQAGRPGGVGGAPSTLLGIVGGLLIVAAGGLAFYASRYGRRRTGSWR